MAATFQNTSASISNWHTRALYKGTAFVPQFLAISENARLQLETFELTSTVMLVIESCGNLVADYF